MDTHSIARTRPVPSPLAQRWRRFVSSPTIFLLAPAALLFIFFFVIPISALVIMSFNETAKTVIRLQTNFTLEHYIRFFSRSVYVRALLNSLRLGAITTVITVLLGYPLAYVVAKTEHPGRNTFLMILILIPLQIDQLVRAYGIMALLGDNGVINATLLERGLISSPLPLMYNTFGIIVGLTQVTIPFMVLSLIGIIRRIAPSLEEAARNLGADRLRSFLHITLPLSMPGILAGSLLVFALTISNFVVPILLGGSNVFVVPMWIYKLIAEINNWQFASAVSVILLLVSLSVVYGYHRVVEHYMEGSLR
jgi:putative spermidine/putrescine transport system permease protein